MSPSSATPRSRWIERAARRWARATTPAELGLRVYTSRLLGADPDLVFAGGGNTSVKTTVRDLFGEPVPALFVKGSGSDLATAEPRDFTPLALAPTLRLLELTRLSDSAMLRELLRARLDPGAPPPSVEALLHAFLPFRYVDHAHPVAALALLDSTHGDARAAELWGEDCLLVPYVKPGFDLARRVRLLWERESARGRRFRGLVLLRHGLFAFADDARASYETLLELVGRAARRLPRGRALARATRRSGLRPAPWRPDEIARLRSAASGAARRPLAMALAVDRELLAFLDRADFGRVARRGTLTPDHVLRTKRLPLLVDRIDEIEATVERYADGYQREFDRFRRGRDLTPLDPAPRVALVPGTGVFGLGRTPAEARIAATIWAQTAWAIARAEALGGWRPLSPRALFEVEYWELEQAKLARASAPAPLAGRAALVTGAASGIGRATAAALLAAGAGVVGLDLVPSELPGEYVGLAGDARSPARIRRALALAARRFGGLDILVANAGVFFAGPRIVALADTDWRRTMAINADAQLTLFREAIPLLRHAPGGGAIVVVGSRNVAAPGPGAAAYSASKAALTQLARVAALELAGDRVRVNVVHPDGVFDTGVWAEEMLAARAASYGLSVKEYRRRNLLGREVRAADVAALVAALAGELFARTTGAQIPIDGGNERVI
jgi:rhamnose utilization protein RhaD (predicted bifunctional aldolase and dehydrogenase)/NAD(P)-dependent dehydrogenase (short-subunit alcohol dehydrogenase family)